MSATLEQALENVSGASFIAIDTETAVALPKSSMMHGRVTKRVVGSNVMVFQNKNSNAYDNMVKRRLEREGKDPESFVLGARAWGVRRPNTPFIDHKGEVYLEVIFLHPGKSSYFLDGAPIKKEDIVGLKETKEDADSQGGLENKVVVRSYKAASIKALRVDGKEYTF